MVHLIHLHPGPVCIEHVHVHVICGLFPDPAITFQLLLVRLTPGQPFLQNRVGDLLFTAEQVIYDVIVYEFFSFHESSFYN